MRQIINALISQIGDILVYGSFSSGLNVGAVK
ncbi:hypothetical protein SPHINGOAX6_71189 [Sphingomonas sp. AX6]|nr:hypothetical protein SPHINGOAX6_71189 [Sphingomonas sp. AX6]